MKDKRILTIIIVALLFMSGVGVFAYQKYTKAAKEAESEKLRAELATAKDQLARDKEKLRTLKQASFGTGGTRLAIGIGYQNSFGTASKFSFSKPQVGKILFSWSSLSTNPPAGLTNSQLAKQALQYAKDLKTEIGGSSLDQVIEDLENVANTESAVENQEDRTEESEDRVRDLEDRVDDDDDNNDGDDNDDSGGTFDTGGDTGGGTSNGDGDGTHLWDTGPDPNRPALIEGENPID